MFKKDQKEESKLKNFSEKVQILNQEEERKVVGGDGGTTTGTGTDPGTGSDPSDARYRPGNNKTK